MTMNDDLRYQRWIKAIAQDIDSGACPIGILQHIQKHAGPDLMWHVLQNQQYGNSPTEWRVWAASMYNLLAIFEEVMLARPVTVEEKLVRLQRHYESHPDTRTPEPV